MSPGLTFRELPIAAAAESAAAILLSDRAPEAMASLEAALDAGRARSVDRPLLLIALRNATVVAAALGQRQPGKIALVWPPRGETREDASTPLELFRELLRRLRQLGVQLVQAFPEMPPERDRQLLVAAGFQHDADLLYMVCLEGQFPESPPALNFSVESYSAGNHQRFLDVLDRTYEGTLDCPTLNGVRAADDVLETYRWTGDYDPARWLLASRDGVDLGCLLLTDHVSDEQWELMYLGLIPEARDRGAGRQLLRHAQWLTRQAGRRRLVLTVDAANAPAVGLYAAEGFTAWDRRSIYLQLMRIL